MQATDRRIGKLQLHADQQMTQVGFSYRDCKDKIREVAGEALQRLIKFLGPMYAAQGESLRTKAAATLANLATDNSANAQALAQLGEPDHWLMNVQWLEIRRTCTILILTGRRRRAYAWQYMPAERLPGKHSPVWRPYRAEMS